MALEGIRALVLKGKGLVCFSCIKADKKLGRLPVHGCITWPDSNPYRCKVCGNAIPDFTEDERITCTLHDRVLAMSDSAKDLFFESLDLVNNQDMDVKEALEKTGFLNVYKTEKGGRPCQTKNTGTG